MATMGVPNGAGKPPSMPGTQFKPMPVMPPNPQRVTPPTAGSPQQLPVMPAKPKPME
jgi:hypothetical protein